MSWGVIRVEWRKTLAGAVAAVLAGALAFAPSAYADMSGIDVSGHQPAGVTRMVDYDFAVVKVNQGTGFVNGSWRAQADGVVSRGKSLGLYDYAAGGNPVAEADYFVALARPFVGRAVLVLDWESRGNAAWGDGGWVRSWVNRVHSRTNVWPMVYVQASAIGQIPADVRATCGLWVAQYGGNAATGYQSRPWNYGRYGEAMRQYSSNGRLAGYPGPLDLDCFRGGRWQWNLYANPGSAVKPDVVPAPAPRPVPAPARRPVPQPANPPARRLAVRVRRGDTMWGIASRYGAWPVSAWRVPSGNPNVVYPGQVVTYGGSGAVPPAPRTRAYVVRSGDSLSGIAARLGVRAGSLTGYRSGNPNLIYPGEVLHY